jgi:hypothetical protein
MPINADAEFVELTDRKKTYLNHLRYLKEDKRLSAKNKRFLFDFIRDCDLGKTLTGRARKKISQLRLARLMIYLKHIGYWLGKDYDRVTVKDMEDFILKFENNTITQKNGNPYSYETKLSYKMALKKFYKWLYGTGEKFNKLVSWIETYQCLKEISALTRKEVEKLVMMRPTILHIGVSGLTNSGCA